MFIFLENPSESAGNVAALAQSTPNSFAILFHPVPRRRSAGGAEQDEARDSERKKISLFRCQPFQVHSETPETCFYIECLQAVSSGVRASIAFDL